MPSRQPPKFPLPLPPTVVCRAAGSSAQLQNAKRQSCAYKRVHDQPTTPLPRIQLRRRSHKYYMFHAILHKRTDRPHSSSTYLLAADRFHLPVSRWPSLHAATLLPQWLHHHSILWRLTSVGCNMSEVKPPESFILSLSQHTDPPSATRRLCKTLSTIRCSFDLLH